MATCVMTSTARPNASMPATARTITTSVPKALPCTTSSRFASGSRLRVTKCLGRCRPQKRQAVTMGIFGLGGPEIAVIAGVAVLIFGPSKIPGLGKEVGKAAKSFQQAAKEFENELKSGADEASDKPSAGESTTKKHQQ
ncbi:hypothetical protein ABBQ32_003942 [Trebouxia sp. C0010 RCD-2024]